MFKRARKRGMLAPIALKLLLSQLMFAVPLLDTSLKWILASNSLGYLGYFLDCEHMLTDGTFYCRCTTSIS